MKKLTENQIDKIKEDILKETFPDVDDNEENIAYAIANISLLMASKFIEKYLDEIDI